MSVKHEIRDAAVTAIAALALTPTPAVQGRKKPNLPSGKSPPAIVVAVDQEADVEDLYANVVLVRYVVTVAIYLSTARTTTDDATIADWTQSIQRELHDRATFAAVGNINDTTRKDLSPLEREALEALYNAAVLQTIVEVIEPRN